MEEGSVTRLPLLDGTKNKMPIFGNSNNSQNNKATETRSELKTKNRGSQCRECDGYGHIQTECANKLKKKKKSLNVTQNDEDSEGSQEDDEHVSNYFAINVYTDKKFFGDSVRDSVVTSSTVDPRNSKEDKSDSDSDGRSDGEDLTIDAIQDAYNTIFNKQVKVCKLNKSLRERVNELVKEKKVLKRAAINYEFLATERGN